MVGLAAVKSPVVQPQQQQNLNQGAAGGVNLQNANLPPITNRIMLDNPSQIHNAVIPDGVPFTDVLINVKAFEGCRVQNVVSRILGFEDFGKYLKQKFKPDEFIYPQGTQEVYLSLADIINRVASEPNNELHKRNGAIQSLGMALKGLQYSDAFLPDNNSHNYAVLVLEEISEKTGNAPSQRVVVIQPTPINPTIGVNINPPIFVIGNLGGGRNNYYHTPTIGNPCNNQPQNNSSNSTGNNNGAGQNEPMPRSQQATAELNTVWAGVAYQFGLLANSGILIPKNRSLPKESYQLKKDETFWTFDNGGLKFKICFVGEKSGEKFYISAENGRIESDFNCRRDLNLVESREVMNLGYYVEKFRKELIK
jgi:hypothetical protein